MASKMRQQVLDQLRRFESPNVTYLPGGEAWPIVWERARGMSVWDVDGKEYLDFTAAFGVAAAGHAAAPVVRAGREQMGRLLHAMGDVHPHPLKGALAERLSRLTFGRWAGVDGKAVFCNSGFEAVEVALKSACQLSGRKRVLAFTGGYHGLGYGSLVATDREHFRGRFGAQLADFVDGVPFPVTSGDLESIEAAMQAILAQGEIGSVIVEPIQARGGIRVPPVGFLAKLRTLCDDYGASLILDEIYTGFGRTGRWFACESEDVVPDFICLGKALTGGFPLSVCVGRADLMDDSWPASQGEAIHTSTYLGHPVGCAMALAQIDLLERRKLSERSASMGEYLRSQLSRSFGDSAERVRIRGQGLLVGIEFRDDRGRPASGVALQLVEDMLASGFVLLPCGEAGNVVALTPPLIVTRSQIKSMVAQLAALYHRNAS